MCLNRIYTDRTAFDPPIHARKTAYSLYVKRLTYQQMSLEEAFENGLLEHEDTVLICMYGVVKTAVVCGPGVMPETILERNLGSIKDLSKPTVWILSESWSPLVYNNCNIRLAFLVINVQTKNTRSTPFKSTGDHRLGRWYDADEGALIRSGAEGEGKAYCSGFHRYARKRDAITRAKNYLTTDNLGTIWHIEVVEGILEDIRTTGNEKLGYCDSLGLVYVGRRWKPMSVVGHKSPGTHEVSELDVDIGYCPGDNRRTSE